MNLDRYVSKQELTRLLSALLVVSGFISIAALFAFLVVPGLRYQAHTGQESAVQPVTGESGWLDLTDYPATARQEIPPIDPATVMTSNPALLARAKTLYDQTCATCHGADGKGGGPGAAGLTPKPRDFTVAGGWKKGTRLEEIYKTLEEGVKGSSMVSYSYLSKKDRMGLSHYVQSLGTFDHGSSDSKALAALESLFRSAGEVIPNRIPVGRAQTLLIQERAPSQPLELGSGLLRRSVKDPVRVDQTVRQLSTSSDAAFAAAVVAGVPGNGFAPEVATYTTEQWKELHSLLVRP